LAEERDGSGECASAKPTPDLTCALRSFDFLQTARRCFTFLGDGTAALVAASAFACLVRADSPVGPRFRFRGRRANALPDIADAGIVFGFVADS